MTTNYINAGGNPNNLPAANAIAEAILQGQISETAAWEATTNIKRCGGMNDRCKAIIHRALKKAGYMFYLAVFSGTHTDPDTQQDYEHTHHKWGIATREYISFLKEDPELDGVETGYTLDHAAHKLGCGDANIGWKMFWYH